jgi:hypothetical protein
VKLSPTPSPELDFEYESRLQEEQMDRAAHLRRWEEIWFGATVCKMKS